MTTKNEALELAQKIESSPGSSVCSIFSNGFCTEVAAMLRSQASEIEKLKTQVESALHCSENANKLSAEFLRERDQLKAKNLALKAAAKQALYSLTYMHGSGPEPKSISEITDELKKAGV